jgi:hypothetical protein
MRSRHLSLSLAVCICGILNGQTATSIDPAVLRLTAAAPVKVNLAEPVPVKVTLTNLGPQALLVPSLRSAWLTIAVKQVPEGSIWRASHGGSVAEVHQRIGQVELTRFERVRQDIATLTPGSTFEWTFDLAGTFGIRLHPGDYTVTAGYEGRLTAEARIHVGISETATVPALIGVIETGDAAGKIWARNSLYILTGYPEWDMDPPPTGAKLEERLEELRSWWSANQARLKLEGSRLVPR